MKRKHFALLTAAMIICAFFSPAWAGELVSMLASKVGITEEQAGGAAGAVFYLAKERMESEDYGKLAGAVSGVESLVGAAGKTKAAESLPKGPDADRSGDFSFLGSSFSNLGLNMDTITQFTPLILGYLQGKGDDSTAGALKSVMPIISASNLTGMLQEKLGVTEPQAKGGAGAVMAYAKSALGDEKFEDVEESIPGMGELLSAAPKQEGLASGLGKTLSSLGGGGKKAAGASGLASSFSSLGLSADMVGQYLPVILSVLQYNGGDTVKNLVAGLFK